MVNVNRDQWITYLWENGIHFLAGASPEMESARRVTPAELISGLAGESDPRLRMALTDLFLLHPDWGQAVPEIIAGLGASAAMELKARYMAAVYLQRLWWTRLGFYIEKMQTLPDWYSRELGLPSPEERHGKVGLVALAEWHNQQSGERFNRLASYNKAADLLFGQLMSERHAREFAATR